MELDPAQPGLAELGQTRPGPIQPGLAARANVLDPARPGWDGPACPARPGGAQPAPARPNPAWPGRPAQPWAQPRQAGPSQSSLAWPDLAWPAWPGRMVEPRQAKPVLAWTPGLVPPGQAGRAGLGQVGLAPLGQGLRKDYTPHHTTRTTISRALKIRTRHVYENQWITEGVRRNLKIDPGVCEINARFENHEGPDRTPPAPDLNVGMSSSQHGLNGIGRLFRTRSDPPQAESRNIEMRCARMLSRCASDPSGVYFANTGPEIRGVRCRLMC